MAMADMVTPPSTPKKLQKKLAKNYSTCLLYNTGESVLRLMGLTIAACNPTSEEGPSVIRYVEPPEEKEVVVQQRADYTSVSEKMSCNYCSVDFSTREEQIKHYKSDWHRYNLRQRIKGLNSVTEERFEEISACVSSISGSESESEDSAAEGGGESNKTKTHNKPVLIPSHLKERRNSCSSNDSEAEMATSCLDESSRRYPKLYFRNRDGELISLYRCVVYHKKNQPTTHNELVTKVTDIPHHMKWVVLMASGGHFAGAVFDHNKIVAHKTFHRYVVRAKRGTAQGSRDSQGNAPKSAGASLRRYNEAALKEDIQDLISTWNDHITNCDLIFLRAPSFNKKLFFSGKSPALKKTDTRIRMIPFATRRPTHNEVRRVHEVLCSIECYGNEADTQDHIPVSPPVAFCPDTGHLEVISDDQLQNSPRHRRNRDKEKLGISPLANANSVDEGGEGKEKVVSEVEKPKLLPKGQQLQVIDALLQSEVMTSSGASTASESELVESMETLSTADLKEYGGTKKPRHRKTRARKRRPSFRRQLEPETDAFAEEKYHLKNSLYTACKIGDYDTLCNLLAIFQTDQSCVLSPVQSMSNSIDSGQNVDSSEKTSDDAKASLSNDDQSVHDSCNLSSHFENKKHSSESEEESKNSVITEVDPSAQTSSDLGIEEVSYTDSSQSILRNRNGDLDRQVTELCSGDSTSVKVDKIGEKSKLNLTVSRTIQSTPEDVLSPVVTCSILNEPIGDQQTTLLHVATKSGHKKLIRALLGAGADPAIGDKYGQTPYLCTTDKELRNEFRRFMAKFPDRYNYETAKIPSALTPEMEAERKKRDNERKRVQRKTKQERLKEKKEEEAIKRAEEREKQRFLSLSDREKRALAAEKRLVQQKVEEGASAPVLSRCFQCGKDMTGKVPFEYYEYKFCTPKCLKEHRTKNTKS